MAARKKGTDLQAALSALRDALQRQVKFSSSEGEELVKLAIDIINQDYWDDVRGITADLVKRIKDGEITDREGLDEALNQDVDGSQRVIYTFQAKLGLLATNNADAYEEDFGEKPEDESKAMYAAMMRDVQAQLEAEDVDSLLSGGDEDD